MSAMDLESGLGDEVSVMEEVVLELEWAVHEAARKRLDGEPAEQELADIDRLLSVQICLAASDAEQRRLSSK